MIKRRKTASPPPTITNEDPSLSHPHKAFNSRCYRCAEAMAKNLSAMVAARDRKIDELAKDLQEASDAYRAAMKLLAGEFELKKKDPGAYEIQTAIRQLKKQLKVPMERWGLWRIDDGTPGYEFHLGRVEQEPVSPGCTLTLVAEFWARDLEEATVLRNIIMEGYCARLDLERYATEGAQEIEDSEPTLLDMSIRYIFMKKAYEAIKEEQKYTYTPLKLRHALALRALEGYQLVIQRFREGLVRMNNVDGTDPSEDEDIIELDGLLRMTPDALRAIDVAANLFPPVKTEVPDGQ